MPQPQDDKKPGLLDRLRADREKRKAKSADGALIRRQRDAERAARRERKGVDGVGYGGPH